MFGIGAVELVILLALVLLLFGAPILTFLFGYALGKKRSSTSEEPLRPQPAPEPSPKPQPAPEPSVPQEPQPPLTAQSAPEEQPADE